MDSRRCAVYLDIATTNALGDGLREELLRQLDVSIQDAVNYACSSSAPPNVGTAQWLLKTVKSGQAKLPDSWCTALIAKGAASCSPDELVLLAHLQPEAVATELESRLPGGLSHYHNRRAFELLPQDLQYRVAMTCLRQHPELTRQRRELIGVPGVPLPPDVVENDKNAEHYFLPSRFADPTYAPVLRGLIRYIGGWRCLPLRIRDQDSDFCVDEPQQFLDLAEFALHEPDVPPRILFELLQFSLHPLTYVLSLRRIVASGGAFAEGELDAFYIVVRASCQLAMTLHGGIDTLLTLRAMETAHVT